MIISILMIVIQNRRKKKKNQHMTIEEMKSLMIGIKQSNIKVNSCSNSYQLCITAVHFFLIINNYKQAVRKDRRFHMVLVSN